MKFVLSEEYALYKNDILNILNNFKNEGVVVGRGNRNVVKYFVVKDLVLNFKSFKQHNIINRHVYKHYRRSKAHRSYDYAHMLLDKGFLTPKPIAYIENYDWIGVTSSYYISEQLQEVCTLADVLADPDFADREQIIKGYTQLIYRLHEHGIIFIDNAAGNFLIKKSEGQYLYFLVDLNRMSFYEEINITKRLKNFERLTNDRKIIESISAEYAKLSGADYELCRKKITDYSAQKARKRKAKKILKFYKYLLPH